MSRLAVASCLMLAALHAGATDAAAAESPLLEPRTVLDGALAAPAGTDAGACHRAYRPGAPRVATRGVEVAGPGALTVRLAGAEGDWDVALFDAAGRVLAGGFGFTFEIYCGEPNYGTGDCDDAAFHPPLPDDGQRVDGREPAGRPRPTTPGPTAASTARATARPTTSRPRAR